MYKILKSQFYNRYNNTFLYKSQCSGVFLVLQEQSIYYVSFRTSKILLQLPGWQSQV